MTTAIDSVFSSLSSVQTGSLNQPDKMQHIVDYLNGIGGSKAVCKIIYHAFDILSFQGHVRSEKQQRIYEATKDAKLVLGGMEFASKLNDLRKQIINPAQSNSISSRFYQMAVKVAGCCGPAWDGCEFLHSKNILSLSQEAFKKGFGCNSAALCLVMGNNLRQDASEALQYINAVQSNTPLRDGSNARLWLVKKVFDIIRDVAFITIGTISLISVLFYSTTAAVWLAPWILVACATTSTVAGVLGHFVGKFNGLEETLHNLPART